MPKRKLYLDEVEEKLKNPTHDEYIMLYDDKEKKDSGMGEPKPKRLTLNDVMNLIKDMREEMNDGFKRVNARIDRIEARLDYNNLKKLPKTIPNK